MNEVYTPVGHFLLVEVEKVEEVSKGGILLPKDLVSKEQVAAVKAKVLKIGPDAWFDKGTHWAEVGDQIVMAKFAGFGLTETRRIIRDEDVMATFTQEWSE